MLKCVIKSFFIFLCCQQNTTFNRAGFDVSNRFNSAHKVSNISVKELKSIGITDSNESMITQIQMLQKHYCLYKSADIHGKIIRGTPLYERLSTD